MFKHLSDLVAFVLTIQQRTETNQKQHDRLAARVDTQDERFLALLSAVQELRAEFRVFVQHERDEREKQELRFQLALERLERRLALPPQSPPASNPGDQP